MRKITIAVMSAAALLAFTGSASAVKKSTVVGAGAGAVAGAAVAGPAGAVAGGYAGSNRLRKIYHRRAVKEDWSPRWKRISPLRAPSASSSASPSPDASSMSSLPAQVKWTSD